MPHFASSDFSSEITKGGVCRLTFLDLIKVFTILFYSYIETFSLQMFPILQYSPFSGCTAHALELPQTATNHSRQDLKLLMLLINIHISFCPPITCPWLLFFTKVWKSDLSVTSSGGINAHLCTLSLFLLVSGNSPYWPHLLFSDFLPIHSNFPQLWIDEIISYSDNLLFLLMS